MTCTITSRGFELLLALQIAPPERFPKNALSILKCNLLEILCTLVEKGYTDFYVNGAYGIPFWSAEMICALKLYHPALRCIWCSPIRNTTPGGNRNSGNVSTDSGKGGRSLLRRAGGNGGLL